MESMTVTRKKMVNVRMSSDEVRMLAELADAVGLGLSDTIRQLVRSAHAKQVAGQPRKAAKK